MDKKLSLGLVSITMILTLSLLGCASNNTNKPSKSVTPQTGSATSNSSTTDKPNSTNSTTDKGTTATETPSAFKYNVATMASDVKIELNTPWESSPLGKFKATIEGKGEKANSEGYAHIIIKEVSSGKLTKLTFKDEETNHLTARDLEWIDENNLFVILGQPFGTVSKGGSIYKVNILSGDTAVYLKTTNAKEEFTAVHKSENIFKFEKYIYEDDNFIKGHSENGTLELK